MRAIELAARMEGMITDPVYEGKPMAGLIDLVSSEEIARDSTVLGQARHFRVCQRFDFRP